MKSFLAALAVILITAWGSALVLDRYQVESSAKFTTGSVRLGTGG
jgi:hypothetical protein